MERFAAKQQVTVHSDLPMSSTEEEGTVVAFRDFFCTAALSNEPDVSPAWSEGLLWMFCSRASPTHPSVLARELEPPRPLYLASLGHDCMT